MKLIRILPILLAAILILTSCGKTYSKNSNVDTEENGITIVTSFYPMYIFTKNITKDVNGVKVINMAEPKTGCLHDYQMTPSDMKKVEQADIMVINGAGLESFIEKIIKERPQLKIIEASKGLELLNGESSHESGDIEEDEHEEDSEQKDHEHSVNAHVWVSITGAIAEVKNIGEQLAAADPDNAEKYRKNTEEYVKKLEAQREKMLNALKGIENRNIVTFHEAFPYFAKEFDLNVIEIIETEEGSSPSAGELAGKIKKIKESNVKALFTDPQNVTNIVQTVSKETGIKVYELDPVVTGPEEPDLDAYIKAMDKNLDVLLEALK
ncbi:metal ABC transporter substrate-binding protein [Acetivibrio clariflavus]|uniref:ABC-type metal ion transport system, periplasmic component/surface adhesin n=1 Tax=Acetivibrio clariflavus (strain DSM 19732 / NBRC 101661 / EBR45) TaxID=720554 RepID=G8LX23_ACECE|nr:metal ABC transporter substrate-binding protein [Acetivibrio clariflavus]AEV67675.1 ABC-type metal ion transport system, periplasmic component/surface adhesin [Acetivibrio clariflavus DSM 19732]